MTLLKDSNGTAGFTYADLSARMPLNARSFGATGQGGDYTDELTEAISVSRSTSRPLFVPEGVYGVNASLTGSETTPMNVYGAGKGLTTFEYNGTAAAMFSALGSIATASTLSAPAARGATAVVLNSVTGLAPGDLLIIRDPTVPILGNNAQTQAAAVGVMRKVRSVVGNTVNLWARLPYAFTTGSDVRKVTTAKNLSLRDFSIVNPVPGTLGTLSRAITWTYAERLEVERVDFTDFDSACIYMQTSWNFRVADCDFYELRDLEQSFNPYSVIATHGTQFGVMEGCKQHYGRHLFTTGPQNTGLEVPSSDILISGCIATGMTQAAFDTHPGSARIHFRDDHVFGSSDKGFQIRGPDSSISGSTVDGATTGILAVDGANRLRVRDFLATNCDIGIEIQDSNDFRGRGILIVDPITTGILVDEEVEWAGTMVKLSLRDVEVTGDPTGNAYDFSDIWNDGYELRDLRAPDATRKITGSPTTPTLDGLLGTGWATGDMVPTGFEGSGLSLALVANTAHLSRYVPPCNRTITKVAFEVTTASGLDDAFDVGIYSLNASASVLTRISSTGAITSASGAIVSGGGLNTGNRHVVTVPTVKVVGGTVYYVAISAAAAGATIQAAGMNDTTGNQMMGTVVPDIVAGSKATSHPLPSTISGPAQVLSGPKVGVLV